MKTKQWQQRHGKTLNNDIVNEIMECCGLPEIAARILVRRGYETADQVMEFLEPDEEGLYDPFLLPDMKPAVMRILAAKKKNETICIFGDYDADGTTAVAILVKYLKTKSYDVFYRIPDRLTEGYGMRIDALEEVIARGASLIITVDNGISALEESEFLSEQNVDLIITDHHECHGELPKALAIIDPKRSDSTYPFRELCGAGIAFKLICAMEQEVGGSIELQEYIECAALATVADIVPLKSENRVITKLGIDYLNEGAKNRGLKALIEVSALRDNKVTAGNIGFILAPKINAAGRLGDAGKVIELYLAETMDEATTAATYLVEENMKRQAVEGNIYDNAISVIAKEKWFEDPILVVSGDDWHSGVIGIVASKLQEIWYKPAIVIGVKDGIGKGSCRSVEGFDIFRTLSSCSELFIKYGGHEQAAGFSIEAAKIPELRARVNGYARENNIDAYLTEKIYYDEAAQISDIDELLAETLESFEPCGVGNPKPQLRFDNVVVSDPKRMGANKNHLSFFGENLRCIAFGRGDDIPMDQENRFSFLARPEINCFRDKKSVQLLVKDLRPWALTNKQEAWALIKEIDLYAEHQMVDLPESARNDLVPTRSALVWVYRIADALSGKGENFDKILEQQKEINAFQFLAALKILQEAQVIAYRLNKGIVYARSLKTQEKKDVQQTPFMIKLKKYSVEG